MLHLPSSWLTPILSICQIVSYPLSFINTLSFFGESLESREREGVTLSQLHSLTQGRKGTLEGGLLERKL